MAMPKWHAIPTAAIGMYAAVKCPPTSITSEGSLILAGVVALGIFMDGDHLSIRRIKKLLRGEKSPVEGWVNWMHTWQALAGVAILSLLVSLLMPGPWYLLMASYGAHQLIDGGCKDSSGAAPLPEFIHRFYPRWMKYKTPSL